MKIPSEPGRPPAVSVIMPAYRTTAYIAEALDSVLAQTFRDFEIIVVNDECPDTVNLERVLEPYLPSIRYLKQEHGGLASARNTAVRAARAPLVALLDSDDAFEPDYLEVQVGLMRSNPDIDVFYPNARLFGDTPHAGRTYMEVFPSRGKVTPSALLSGQCTVFIGVIARREAIVRAGLFDPALLSVEDFDLWLRILDQGGTIAYHHRPLARYRCRPGSLTRDSLAYHRQLLGALDKADKTLHLDGDGRRCLEQAIVRETAWFHHIAGKQAFFDGDTEAAYSNLLQANRHLQSKKIALILFLMRRAPQLLRWLAKLRYDKSAAVQH